LLNLSKFIISVICETATDELMNPNINAANANAHQIKNLSFSTNKEMEEQANHLATDLKDKENLKSSYSCASTSGSLRNFFDVMSPNERVSVV